MNSTILNFYNEKEIFEARNILFQLGNDAINTVGNDEAELDGWFKVLNNKGMLVIRRGSDEKTREELEVEDIYTMYSALDKSMISLPMFVARRSDRLPPCLLNISVIAQKKADTALADTALADTLAGISACLINIEKHFQNTAKTSVDHATVKTSADHATVKTSVDHATGSSILWSDMVCQSSDLSGSSGKQTIPKDTESAGMSPTSSSFQPLISRSIPRTVIRGTRTSSSIKTIPRQAVCFASRLDLNTTEEELTSMLSSSGLTNVKCKRLVPKSGQTFYTAAFRVACDLGSKEKLFDPMVWPQHTEVREWVFKS